MITFYPGPSKVYPQAAQYIQEAFDSGIISANHRSEQFMQMLRDTIETLKSRLSVPEDYEVYFVSSATECWEIIAQSVMIDCSLHMYNGAFGEKWAEYTQRITGQTSSYVFDLNESPVWKAAEISSPDDVICITHNETSNGTSVPNDFLASVRSACDNVIAVDATSSMAGADLPWQLADIWYASVQKCFGLPAGMGVMIVSPRAVAQAERKSERAHYNSLLFMRENFLKFQTPYTPNVLGIFLLNKIMSQVAPIHVVAGNLAERATQWYLFLEKNGYEPLIKNKAVRSDTVIAVKASAEKIKQLKTGAKQEGIVLGNGYGREKDITFRIANFPAIDDTEVEKLQDFLARSSEKRPNE